MPKFVELVDVSRYVPRWVNPDHVVELVPHPVHDERSHVSLSDGSTFTVALSVSDVRKRLNGTEGYL